MRITPRAGTDAIDGWQGDVLLLRVSAAPVDGKANDALLRLLAKALRIAPSRLTLVSGVRSRLKTIDVDGMSSSDVRRALGP